MRVYIKELQRLGEAGLENASVNELYQETLDKIREIMPDLSVSIDETTGAVEGGTDALLAQAEAWENQENATDALRVLEDAKKCLRNHQTGRGRKPRSYGRAWRRIRHDKRTN